MTMKEVLVQARKLIEKPENWKQGGLATADAKKGEAVGPFCAIGAIGKTLEIWGIGVGGNRAGTEGCFFVQASERNHGNAEALATYERAKGLLEKSLPAPIHQYNDSHDHACVLAAFDAAIEKAEPVAK